ncbi:MAG TPA: ABC transporter permease, partial [Methylomirabilota bacterium]|nr:ABC transporter permease [Methylomirabilota bacterium]
MSDLRFAFRQLLKNPGFTAVAVLTLGLVIGVCTTLFAVFNHQFFQPLPLTAPETLVKLARTNERGDLDIHLDAARLTEIQRQSRSFDGLAAFSKVGRIRWTGREEAMHLTPRRVSPGFFDVFGIEPRPGRPFDAVDAETPANHVIIDHGLWVQEFNGDTNVIGRTMILDGLPHTSVGVMPREVSRIGAASQDGAWAGDVWLPHDFTSSEDQTWFRVVGRLRAGTTFEQAREEMR